jgi:Glycosyl transferase family 2
MRAVVVRYRKVFFRIWRAIAKPITFPFSEIYYIFRYILPPFVSSYYHGRSLDRISEDPPRRSKRSVVAVVAYYGNERLIPGFLRYHRRIGVEDFVFLDLSPQHRLADLLEWESDCVVWRPRGTPSPRLAIHWLNFLRRRYGIGRWCLSLEPSEFLVFQRSESRDIRDLIEFLVVEQRNHLFALSVDMYGDQHAAAIPFSAGDDPLAALPYFDPVGYACHGVGRLRSLPTRGGVQRRILFADAPRNAPALNRIPLVKWRWYFSYLAATRLMAPGQLNTAHAPWHLSPTACLLRCALLDDDLSLAIAERAERTVLVADRATPSYPGVFKLRELRLKHSASARFSTSQDLVKWGLLTPGQWF